MLIFADGGAVLIVRLCIFFGIQQGVDEETIQKLREYDWDDFNAERRFREHQTSLLDCKELLLEEKETKESQPESVEALLFP